MGSLETHQELHISFLPFLAPGHLIPVVETARLFASRGARATIITTPSNALSFQKVIDQETTAGRQIRLHILKFPWQEVGLPEGVENFTSVPSLEMAKRLYQAMMKLQPQMEQAIRESHPDCLISDMFYPWTADLAADLKIPRIVFHVAGFFTLSAMDSVKRYPPHENGLPDTQPFALPGLLDDIVMTKLQLPDHVREPNGYSKWLDQIREAETRSHGVVVNSFYELEPAYVEHYQKVTGSKAWHIGPISLCVNKDGDNKASRGNQSSIDEEKCLSWLDSKEPNSVLYVSFGTLTSFNTAQLLELAAGLESAGHPFIWVVRKGQKEGEKEEERWLPEGFEERLMESNKGMIIRGWAPQVLILDHPAIGGFVTHCGWNGVLESVTAGVPMITWPLSSEQFYSEKLVSKVLKVGVEVGVEEWTQLIQPETSFVSKEKIEKAVKRLMSGCEEVQAMRRRVKELGEKAKRSVEEGGSSYASFNALMEELKSLKKH